LTNQLQPESLQSIKTCKEEREKSPFTTRTYNFLMVERLSNINDLAAKSEEDLARLTGFGPKTINEIKFVLSGYGLQLKGGIQWQTNYHQKH